MVQMTVYLIDDEVLREIDGHFEQRLLYRQNILYIFVVICSVEYIVAFTKLYFTLTIFGRKTCVDTYY